MTLPGSKTTTAQHRQAVEIVRLEQLVARRRERVADAERKLAEARKRLKPGPPVTSTRHGAAKRKRTASGGPS